ncbi:MAG: GNAT family N-acetyltransferase [Bacteroidia bacterium]|nr:GNAT family N-acetyltransferase [Bacteroidia bacterium]
MMENFQCGRWIADGQYMRDVPPEKLYQGFIETFTPGSNENACRILDDTGIYAITKQNWDSTFFGFDIARIEIYNNGTINKAHFDALIQWAKDKNISYLTTRASLANTSLVNFWAENGFKLLTSKYMLRHAIAAMNSPEVPEGFEFASLGPYELNEIMDFAGSSFGHSRFMADPAFTRKRIEEMYNSWLNNFLLAPENKIITLRHKQQTIGFCAFSKSIALYKLQHTMPPHGFVSLIAVRPEFRGKNLGVLLLEKTKQVLKDAGINLVFANVDLMNTGSLRMFQHSAYQVFNTFSEYKLALKYK